MATITAHDRPPAYTVVEPLDEDGTCTLHERVGDADFHVVDYADEVLRERVAARGVGEAIRVDLAPADPDGLDWIVTRVHPGGAATPGGAW